MSRKFMAMLVSSALLLGSVSTSALSATESLKAQAQTVQTSAVKNESPLPPGGAAGIKEAQGIENSPWLGIGLVAGIILVAWLLLDDDEDDEAPTSTN